MVTLAPSRPLSKTKRFTVASIDKKAQVGGHGGVEEDGTRGSGGACHAWQQQRQPGAVHPCRHPASVLISPSKAPNSPALPPAPCRATAVSGRTAPRGAPPLFSAAR